MICEVLSYALFGQQKRTESPTPYEVPSTLLGSCTRKKKIRTQTLTATSRERKTFKWLFVIGLKGLKEMFYIKSIVGTQGREPSILPDKISRGFEERSSVL